jgi:hypothetical protein
MFHLWFFSLCCVQYVSCSTCTRPHLKYLYFAALDFFPKWNLGYLLQLCKTGPGKKLFTVSRFPIMFALSLTFWIAVELVYTLISMSRSAIWPEKMCWGWLHRHPEWDKKWLNLRHIRAISDVLDHSRTRSQPNSTTRSLIWPEKICWGWARRQPGRGKKLPNLHYTCTVSDFLNHIRTRLPRTSMSHSLIWPEKCAGVECVDRRDPVRSYYISVIFVPFLTFWVTVELVYTLLW